MANEAGVAMNTPKNAAKGPGTRLLVLILGISIAIAAAWYYQMYKPKMTELTRLKRELSDKQQQLNVIRKMRPQRDLLRTEILRKQQTLDSLKAIFPDRKEVPRLIHEITRLSRSSEIYTTRFNPLKSEVREYYIENHFSVALQGRYHNFGEFLSKLASLRLIVNLSDMHIDTHRSVGGRQMSPEEFDELPYTIIATFKMTTFSSKN